ncbi:S-adenosyl-L-methionine-dependent methyltransferase [Phlegmacium glaucopus]|nr:S-adenosyl-L-methionine-dependent methyltransferase [Phlegmacium glaucopus]
MALNHDGQVSALISLIVNAGKALEQHFAKSAKPFIPSLDDTEPHPVDSEIFNKELRTTIQVIEAACLQLSSTAGRPSHTLVNRLMAGYEPACLNVAMTYKFPDILQEKPAGMHISELGKKSGVEERKAGRILRLLASRHIFREVSQNVFANNRLSIQLLSSNPLSNLGLHFTDECLKSAVLLPDVLADQEWSHSYAPNHTAFNKLIRSPEPAFHYLEKPEGAMIRERFAIGMMAFGSVSEAYAVITEFPWKELGNGASVCDVGGGVGAVTLRLAKAYPHLQLKLQDLPNVIVQAKNEVWPKDCPEAIKEDRIQFHPIDFLKDSPIPGCNVYYMKNIMHDWPDADCIQILSNVRKAMAPHSRILVQEFILQHANRVPEEQSAFKQAPEPLLPNYGAGRSFQYNLDLDMLCMLNSEERRLDSFIKLGNEAGLKFEKLWDFGEMGLVEYRLPA